MTGNVFYSYSLICEARLETVEDQDVNWSVDDIDHINNLNEIR